MGGARGSGQAGAVRRAVLRPLAAAALLLAGCTETTSGAGPSQPSVSAAQLAGTNWTLIHFQSSDDAIGTVVPPNVEHYTLHFGADGALSLQLDCNRGTAHWTATPTSAHGGALAISPGAMTRAMCAPGAIDTKLASDLARVRSYTLADGKLSLALEADAGIYLWAPAAPGAG